MLDELVDCQRIVDKLMHLLGNNINIMNNKGVIIASGETKRINTIHEAAKLAIEEGREIIVDECNGKMDKYKGSKKVLTCQYTTMVKSLGLWG